MNGINNFKKEIAINLLHNFITFSEINRLILICKN